MIHVTPRGRRWAVCKPGAKRAMFVVESRDTAVFAAKCYAKIVYVFGADGRLAERIEQ